MSINPCCSIYAYSWHFAIEMSAYSRSSATRFSAIDMDIPMAKSEGKNAYSWGEYALYRAGGWVGYIYIVFILYLFPAPPGCCHNRPGHCSALNIAAPAPSFGHQPPLIILWDTRPPPRLSDVCRGWMARRAFGCSAKSASTHRFLEYWLRKKAATARSIHHRFMSHKSI